MASVRNRKSGSSLHTIVCAVSLTVVGGMVAFQPLPSAVASQSQATTSDEIRYGQHIRPILSDRCFKCHGPDEAARQAKLQLDNPISATADRGGYAAIVPGDVEASELWLRVNHHDAGERMPPKDSGKKPLSAQEKSMLRQWIEAGAQYEDHWSYIAPQRPEIPAVVDEAWCRTDIDRFILSRLEREGLAPSPQAERTTLFRRVFMDLTGLPPTPLEIDEFLADQQPDAYERWVDRLLTTEPYRSRFAENWAARWLDAARYGDTSGIHMDNGRQIWLWRDWVLSALRDNMPYDQFIIEQLAGDLLPEATVSQKIASGFNRNHVTTDEGGAISEEYLVEYAVDRVNTTSAVFLGLTMRCARCHDHKYDPIPQVEFYRFMSFFNSIEEPGLYSQTPDSNRAYEPFLEVPTPAQQESVAAMTEQIAQLKLQMEQAHPGEAEERAAYMRDIVERTGTRWSVPEVVSAASSDARVSLDLQEDGSIQASGPVPGQEDYVIQLRSSEQDLRMVLLEALATPGAGPGAGRASHGNAVISRLTLETKPAESKQPWQVIPMRWVWSDHSQTNRDFDATNLLRDDQTLGWAVDGNDSAGERLLCLLADEPFGFDGETHLRLKIEFRSPYPSHSLGRIRVRLGALSEVGLAALPPALGRWYVAGHFPSKDRAKAFDEIQGPENLTSIDVTQEFGDDKKTFRFDGKLTDERVVALLGGVGSNYLGRVIFSPDAREMTVSLGSDDAFRLFVNGIEVAKEEVDRGVAPDQSEATIPLQAGPNSLILKIVNTGGPSGYYFRAMTPDQALTHGLVAAIMPADALTEKQAARLAAVWRRKASPSYRQAETDLATTQAERTKLKRSIPRTMIMKDRAEPRETFVLVRGQYDQPDKTQPVTPGVPAMLGALPEGAPPNRLGLARWMTAPDNPLVARVAVNRMWQTLFDTGLVRTSDDFGLQGEWPAHPELLDWLAVDFRESGWDVHRLLRMIITSSTYRQSSRIREALQDVDPDNRLHWRYPRRRMTVEQIRDQALYVSALLDETFGGPSVKPYQPPGLWREVAMPSSNTRIFERGGLEDLWRRTLYTYLKRASPPPSLQIFDAPTREACVIKRPTTNTPLQALVLWNDEQFVEASRVLAQRTLAESGGDEAQIVSMFRRCTGHEPESDDLAQLQSALMHFRTRYADSPEDAAQLLEVGEAPVPPELDPAELAAWTVIASSILNLHETLTQD